MENQVDYSEGYNPYQTALSATGALIPGAISGAVGLGAKKLFKSSDYIDMMEQENEFTWSLLKLVEHF